MENQHSSNKKSSIFDAQSLPKVKKNTYPKPLAKQHWKIRKIIPKAPKMRPQKHSKIIKNLIWVSLGAQPGLQAPSGHPEKLPRPLPDLFFGAPGTLLDMFLDGFKQQNKKKKNDQNKEKGNKRKNALAPS